MKELESWWALLGLRWLPLVFRAGPCHRILPHGHLLERKVHHVVLQYGLLTSSHHGRFVPAVSLQLRASRTLLGTLSRQTYLFRFSQYRTPTRKYLDLTFACRCVIRRTNHHQWCLSYSGLTTSRSELICMFFRVMKAVWLHSQAALFDLVW